MNETRGEMQFEDVGEEFGAPPERTSGFDIPGKLLLWGVVSSRQQAEYVLVVIVILVVLLAGYFFFGSLGGTDVPPPPVA